MSPTLISTLALLFVSYTHNVKASWSMRADTLINARMDPLVNPGVVGAHVHSIVGASNFAATYDYNKLRQSSCSSVEVQDDKSNYWAPSLYYKHRDTGKFELVESHWAVYYLHRGEEKEIKQFPEGFHMIAGSANKQSNNSTDDDAFNYHCLGTDLPEGLELPKRHCPGGLRIQVMFQSCWNGKDVASANHKDHVSYPVGTHEGGKCPTTHPVRFITIFLEQIADTFKYEYYDGAFVLSTGDNVGYSNHADFQNGWDASPNSVLQQAINTCLSPSAGLDGCDVLKASIGKSFNVCRPTTKLPIEDVGFYGGIDKLPGDNQIWGGSVPKKKSTEPINVPPFGSAVSTLPAGWVYHGCIDEGDPGAHSLEGEIFEDAVNMYPGLCVEHCDKKGFKLAGLQSGKECNCANELTHHGSMTLMEPSACNSICPGSHYELCGQSRKINLYKKTGDTTSKNDGPVYPPAGARLTQVFTSTGTTPVLAVANPPMDDSPANATAPTTTTSGTPQSPDSPPMAPTTTTSGTPQSPDAPATAPTTTTPGTPQIPDSPPMAPTTSTSGTPQIPDSPAMAPTTSTSGTPQSLNSRSTDPSAATPTEPVCQGGKLIKRRPGFQTLNPDPKHIISRHRRMHRRMRH